MQHRVLRQILYFLIVFFPIALRFLYFGFQYFPQLDDYIQYGNYPTSIDYLLLIQEAGLFASRPLAGISDIFLWGQFWDHMIIALMLICVLWAFAALLFRKVFQRWFGCGMIFLIVFALMPLGFEGTYWISASSRIVVGLFFTALALYLLEWWMETGRWYWLVLWLPCLLLSFCYYEQILVLSLTLSLLSVLLHFRSKGAFMGLLSLPMVGLYFWFTSHFSTGLLASRVKVIWPNNPYYFHEFLPQVWEQIRAVFFEAGIAITGKGFLRGIVQIFQDGAWFYLLCVALASALYYFLTRCHRQSKGKLVPQRSTLIGLVFGIVLVVAPVSLFFIIENPWVSLRAAVASFVGFALLADILCRVLLRHHRIFQGILAAVLVFVFTVASVSELHDYKMNCEKDQAIVGTIEEFMTRECQTAGILNLKSTYLKDQNYSYHEHVCGITENSWALSGAVAALASDDNYPQTVIPYEIKDGICYESWEADTKSPDRLNTLWWYNENENRVIPLFLQGSASEGWEATSEDGAIHCMIRPDEKCNGQIEMIP